jgi:hypothetical protein
MEHMDTNDIHNYGTIYISDKIKNQYNEQNLQYKP